ncbi:phenazine biosynthesis protein PhzF [Caloranaerobacter sp. TR13]|uniref:PhzF family phenazine biosynthesis protein n=1 Tax=Caloranaerobacter sp. TR13 TaxID=1302151 RepID=UPI0006D3C01E|nr:PhzF family phenazine biosynthesis protein [Caloranaerobacter sp. TR13]KPU26275.1 phenazine biosynthesis protein PhzF [Caloranaerobacter sp. TR13]
MDLIIYQVDSFADKPFCGNPAGVVPDSKGLRSHEMQKIAAEMNLSETAFVIPIDKSNFEVRFFTPQCEVDLCGHATIAAFYTLAKKGYIKAKENGIIRVIQKTKVGELPVKIFFNNGKVQKVMMQQGSPKSYGIVDDLDSISEFMNIDSSLIGLKDFDLKPEIISTGLKDIIIPVRSKKILNNLKINFDKLKKYTIEKDIIGIHVFSVNSSQNIEEVYCRNFAPAVGIKEEAATGTSNGALIYYLKKNKLLKGNSIMAYQGETLNRPSQIYCEIIEKDNNYVVYVGGRAKIVLEGIITI